VQRAVVRERINSDSECYSLPNCTNREKRIARAGPRPGSWHSSRIASLPSAGVCLDCLNGLILGSSAIRTMTGWTGTG